MTADFSVVFPGQGAQFPAMLAELGKCYPSIEQTFQQASALLGYDLWDIVQRNPENALNNTLYTQPAMLVANIAVWRVFTASLTYRPKMVAGHSLGEYAALVAADVLTFADAVKLVALRAQLMQAAVAPELGAMAAIIGLDSETVATLCRRASLDDIVEAVNFNAPNQIVIAGHRSAVERLRQMASVEGARRTLMLPVSVPAHSSLMRPAAAKLEQQLSCTRLTQAAIPVVHNVNASIAKDTHAIRHALTTHLYRPVRWVETIEKMRQSTTIFLEVGPGNVLTGLIKRIAKDVDVVSVNQPEDLAKVEHLLTGGR